MIFEKLGAVIETFALIMRSKLEKSLWLWVGRPCFYHSAGTCVCCSTWILSVDRAALVFNTTVFIPYPSAPGRQQYKINNVVLFVQNACIEKLISMYKILKEVQTNDNKILYVFINDYIRTTLSSHRRRCDWFNNPMSWSEARCQSRRVSQQRGALLICLSAVMSTPRAKRSDSKGKSYAGKLGVLAWKNCVTSGHSNAGGEHEMNRRSVIAYKFIILEFKINN